MLNKRNYARTLWLLDVGKGDVCGWGVVGRRWGELGGKAGPTETKAALLSAAGVGIAVPVRTLEIA